MCCKTYRRNEIGICYECKKSINNSLYIAAAVLVKADDTKKNSDCCYDRVGWDYVYTVDGEEYRKSQMMSVTFKLWKEDEMAAHIGEKLVVHYAPDHPEISWAETPEKRT